MHTTKLNFINRSNDYENLNVAIFQKPSIPTFDISVIAWKVINHCSPGGADSFVFELPMQISVGDSYKNFSPQVATFPGESFEIVEAPSGYTLKKMDTPANRPSAVQIHNNMSIAVSDINVYRSGMLLANKNILASGQMTSFDFLPHLFIGVVPNIAQGDVINQAIQDGIHEKIELEGLASADIVMQGGNGEPFQFSLENQVFS